jgi:hypothetical protein
MTDSFLLDDKFDANKHVPVLSKEAPDEPDDAAHDRPDIPCASAFAKGAIVTNMRTKQKAVVHRVDLVTRQMRLWYPDRKDLPIKQQFDGRTEWRSFDEWIPEIKLSPEEVERQEAKRLFEKELEAFDADGLQLVTVFCDDPDPVKALAKIRAMKKTGIVKLAANAAPVEEPENLTPPKELATSIRKGNK